MSLIIQIGSSINYYLNLVFAGELHQSNKRLGWKYKVKDGQTYAVFRETFSDRDYQESQVTLVVHFRLIIVGSNPFFHWLFQHLCVLDTPMWCGFPGFKTKFWMVDLKSKDYLGIYRYEGRKNAEIYANYISTILKPLSTKNSVWYEIIQSSFEDYLKKTRV